MKIDSNLNKPSQLCRMKDWYLCTMKVHSSSCKKCCGICSAASPASCMGKANCLHSSENQRQPQKHTSLKLQITNILSNKIQSWGTRIPLDEQTLLHIWGLTFCSFVCGEDDLFLKNEQQRKQEASHTVRCLRFAGEDFLFTHKYEQTHTYYVITLSESQQKFQKYNHCSAHCRMKTFLVRGSVIWGRESSCSEPRFDDFAMQNYAVRVVDLCQ